MLFFLFFGVRDFFFSFLICACSRTHYECFPCIANVNSCHSLTKHFYNIRPTCRRHFFPVEFFVQTLLELIHSLAHTQIRRTRIQVNEWKGNESSDKRQHRSRMTINRRQLTSEVKSATVSYHRLLVRLGFCATIVGAYATLFLYENNFEQLCERAGRRNATISSTRANNRSHSAIIVFEFTHTHTYLHRHGKHIPLLRTCAIRVSHLFHTKCNWI